MYFEAILILAHFVWSAELSADALVLLILVYAIAGVCLVKVSLLAALSKFCPIAAMANWA